jgi:hypothetical protein
LEENTKRIEQDRKAIGELFLALACIKEKLGITDEEVKAYKEDFIDKYKKNLAKPDIQSEGTGDDEGDSRHGESIILPS